MSSTIDKAIDAAEALSPAAIGVYPQWCTRVRNNRSNCSACMDACPQGAVLAFENEITIDPDTCTGCGACAAACPTGALACKNPPRGELAQQIERIARGGSKLAFCCEASGLRQSDDARFVEVACLAQLDEALIAHAVARGIEAIALVSGECAACPNSEAEPQIEALVHRSEQVLDFWGLQQARLSRKTEHGAPHTPTNPAQRRMALQGLADEAKLFAVNAMERSLQENRGSKPETLASMLASSNGHLPQRVPPRASMLLNDLYSLDRKPSKQWNTRLFAQVRINEEACNKCGKCAFFCPTGALRFHGEPARPAVMGVAATAEESFHTFRACDCVNCGLCVDTCQAHALKLENVNAKDLFELEPQSPYLGD